MVTFQELKIAPDGQKLIIDVSVKDLGYYTNVYLDRILIDNQDSFLESGPSSSALSIIPTNDKIVKVDNYSFDTVSETLYRFKYTLEEGVVYDFCNLRIEDSFEGQNILLDFVGQGYNFDYSSSYLKGKTLLFKEGDFVEYSIKSIRMEINHSRLLHNLNQDLLFVYVKTKGSPSADTPCGMDNTIVLGVVGNKYPIYQSSIAYLKELEMNCSIPKNFINYILQDRALELAIKTGHYTEAIKYWKRLFMGIKGSMITPNCGCYGQGT